MSQFIFKFSQTANKRPGGGNRLPATKSSMKPDCNSIKKAEESDKPENWLLFPFGHVFKFDVQKAEKPP